MFSNGARYVAEFRDSSRSAHGIQTYPSGKCATLCFLTLRESCGASQKDVVSAQSVVPTHRPLEASR
jgi:hypothetical protein